ncbi:unnamed protein product [Cladocopium goreaui]|uniref:Uncharacterized protein n=1 Tax=Cladocopium goreaui TaxID=2562237 RepID=A0A9P1GFG7_9DINO|nr:unnamed protein product [Cladocopium goreaui]
MDDFLWTSIRYYYSRFKLDSDHVKPAPSTPVEDAFATVLSRLGIFIEEAATVEEEYRRKCVETLDAFQQKRHVALMQQAAETFAAVCDLAKELLPKVQQQETLPAEVLQKLNATMSASESRYSGAVVTCLKLGSGTSWDQSPDLKLLAQLKRDQDAEG